MSDARFEHGEQVLYRNQEYSVLSRFLLPTGYYYNLMRDNTYVLVTWESDLSPVRQLRVHTLNGKEIICYE